MKKLYLTLLISLLSLCSYASALTGVVKADNEPIIGAEIFWQNTTIGATSNRDGSFQINRSETSDTLIVRYLGFKTERIFVANTHAPIQITLTEKQQKLDEVEVLARAASTVTSRITPIQTQTISAAELCKAACCNLSESFETNASVDVAYSDAATGAKQIRLLGLSGTYVQLLTENTPGIRGLASNYGLEYIPGPWMESIQVSKGTSSVINGYEATTGQINVEYLKPQKTNPIALNLMVNSDLRTEFNATGGWDINEKLSTGILAHYKNESIEMDGNNDGFMDLPKSQQINVLNR
ncbi:MAG: carboxypeptidase-like regulatory domain-containing protein, partial [Paludibacteraceae bacterium]|nr:carboxypeptidase-like regulatory domain-containing protein [Paludibacteraceae bacterium]